MRRWMVLLAILLMSDTGWPATYYVSTAGNDANSGAVDSPWRNPNRCSKTPIAPGDTCVVKAGTYQASDWGSTYATIYISSSQGSIAGTASAPITIKSEVPLGAVLKVPSLNSGTAGVHIGQPYYVLEGFDVNGTGTSWSTGTSTAAFGVRVTVSGVTIRKNHIWDIASTMCSNSAFGQGGILISGGVSGTVIDGNRFHKIGRLRNGESGCSTVVFQHDHAIYSGGAINEVIKRNIFYDVTRGYPIVLYASGATHSNVSIINNTISGKSPTGAPVGQISLSNTLVNVTIKNNIFRDATLGYVVNYSAGTTASGVVISSNIQDSQDSDATLDMQNPNNRPSTGITSSGNIFNATLGLKNTSAGSEDFSLTASSAAIDAGVNVGLLYNGAAPDMGAHETWTFSSCAVTASTKIQASYTNNVNPPILPSSGVTIFTARKNAVSNPVSVGGVVVGDNVVEITLTNSYVGGDTADISWSSGNLTDSALIGGSSNQPFLATLTNQSCTNTLAGVSYTLTQAAFEFHDAYGTEASPTILPLGWASTGAAENLSIAYPIYGGGKIRIRFAIVCAVAACPDDGYLLWYSRNAGSYTQVPDTSGSDGVQFCGLITTSPSNGSATTNQLSTAGTFVPGGIVYTSNAIPLITGLSAGSKTELEYCIKYDQSASGTFDFRVYHQQGTAMNTYTATPRNLIVAPAFGSF